MTKKEFELKNIGFNNEREYLSNFYNSPFKYGDILFNNVEQAFQEMKQSNKDVLIKFSKLSASEAKREGRRITLRRDWEKVKDIIMTRLVNYKFKQNSNLLNKLMQEDDSNLVEYNYWHDNYWGHCLCEECKDKEKKNKLGKILKSIKYEEKSNSDLIENLNKIENVYNKSIYYIDEYGDISLRNDFLKYIVTSFVNYNNL